MAWSRSKPRRQSCVLLASSVQIEKKPGSTHSLNGVPLLLGHGNSLSSRRQGGVVVSVLAEQAEELLGVLGNQLGQLWVASAELLQDRLQHLGLLLHNLAKLLELRVVSQEVQVAEPLPASSRSGDGGGGSRASTGASTTGTGPAGTTSSLLCGQVEQVHTVITTSRGRGCGRRRGRSRLGGWCGLLLLLQVVWDSLQFRQPYVSIVLLHGLAHVQEVLDRAVWVVESGAHGSIDLGPLEAHRLHVRDGLGTLTSQS